MAHLRGGVGWVAAGSLFIASWLTSSTALAASPSHGTPTIQRIRVDDVVEDPFEKVCGFPMEDHEVGTIKIFGFPDGRAVLDQNLLVTVTRPDLGTSFTYRSSLKVTDIQVTDLLPSGGRTETFTTTFTGLNYQILQPGGAFVSAGKGVVTVTLTFDEEGNIVDVEFGEIATPNLLHFTDVLCSAVLGERLGKGSIVGTVTSDQSGAPLQEVCVSAYQADTGGFVGNGYTDAEGRYRIGLLLAGQYKVAFEDCSDVPLYLGEWYEGEPDFDSADPVVVRGRAEIRIDAALTRGGSISGTVTSEATGKPLARICVQIVPADDESGFDGFAQTGDDGSYFVGALQAGNHKVEFSDCTLGPYLREWYDDEPDFDSADPVSVTVSRDTPGIDGALAEGGSIAGTVVDGESGAGVEGVCAAVYAIDSTEPVSFGVTDASGDYVTGGLPTGKFKVRFEDCYNQVYAHEWYDNERTSSSADPVSVSAGTETSGIDATLAVGGTIAGTVVEDGSGRPLVDVCVAAYDVAEGQFARPLDDPFVHTESDGSYRFGGLGEGIYKVLFRDCGPEVHIPEWYDDEPDLASADSVSVSLGEETSGIDAALAVA